MKLYRVYSGDENRNKETWQTENAEDISSIINMDSFYPISISYFISRKLILTHLPKKTATMIPGVPFKL